MVTSAALLLREHGAAGVTVDAVLAHSGAPRGSVYHHFPGGRTEMLEAAVAYAGTYMRSRLARAVESRDPVSSVESFCRYWRRQLAESDYRAGCPVVAVAVEGDEKLAGAVGLAREAFESWREVLVGSMVDAGIEPARADRLARTVLAAVEGAVVLCRAEGDTAALDAVSAEMSGLIRDALPTG